MRLCSIISLSHRRDLLSVVSNSWFIYKILTKIRTVNESILSPNRDSNHQKIVDD